jgi:S1-C subfamily serine protease
METVERAINATFANPVASVVSNATIIYGDFGVNAAGAGRQNGMRKTEYVASMDGWMIGGARRMGRPVANRERGDCMDSPLGDFNEPTEVDGFVAPPVRREKENHFPWRSLIWATVFLFTLVSSPLLVPKLVEGTQYALRRGPERAAAEAARDVLNDIELKDLSQGFHLVPKAVAPSVVHINIQRGRETRRSDRVWQFGPEQQQVGQGSGVIIDAEGYVVTNDHVVVGALRIDVVLSDGSRRRAAVVGSDPLTDLALLKIESGDLIAAPWGDSDVLEVGSFVWAFGSPFGLDHTVTFGIISAKDRRQITRNAHNLFLQTDAGVNPGNSGGPLVNFKGEIIGINTAIVGPSFQGVSFAIPSSVAKEICEKLKQEGEIARGWLGVALASEEWIEQSGIEKPAGALVQQVIKPSPAWEAGIRPGDDVIEWDGRKVDDPSSLTRMVAETEIGKKVVVIVMRGEERLSLEALVDRRPAM